MRRILVMVALVLLAAGAAYVYWGRPAAKPPAPVAAQPAPEVGVMSVTAAEIPVPVVYAGRVAGYRDIEIRSQVSGILTERPFEEGARVDAGQVLFRVDRRPFEVARDRALAQLAQAQATARQAEENFRRVEELSRRQVAAEQALDQARAARDQSQAGVQLAQAELKNAELNLSYTEIKAPVVGTTALTSPPVGSLIQAQQTLLTMLTQLDPAYVNFSVTDAEYQSFRDLNQKRAKPITEADLDVQLQYGSGAVYPERGRVEVSASSIDVRTGTLQVRAIFPNSKGELLPGQFVRVMVRGITLPNAIVVPKQAVSQGPQGPFVYVVGDNQVAQARPIKLGAEVSDGWVAQNGLTSGERIVVDGVIRTRPGAPVRPVPMQAATGNGEAKK